MKPSRLIPVLSAVAALALAGCASGAQTDDATASSAAPPSAATGAAVPSSGDAAAVELKNIAFKPAEITVLRGTEVTWVNADENVSHTVTSGVGGDNGVPGVEDATPNEPDGLFNGAVSNTGDDFSHTFEETGEFAYFCEIHPSMRGVVIVE